jgi:hypothetical protein
MNDISKKQLEANRQNAKLGGVKTEEGKAVSKYNAIKHGLLCKGVVLEDEDGQELLVLEKKIRSELKPANEIEFLLVDRIIANTWRLKRAMQIESEMIKDDRKSTFGDKLRTLGQAFSYDFVNNDTYGKFIRYEASIERGIYKALHELQRLQSVRIGDDVPAPAVVDVNIYKDE